MPQDLGDTRPPSNQEDSQPSGRPMVTFPPSPSPKLPRTRRASPPPAPGRLLRPPAPGEARPSGPGLQPPPPPPSSPAQAGGPRREVRRGSGAWALPGAGARLRGPRQTGHSREAVTARLAGGSAPRSSPRPPRPATRPAQPQTKIKRPTPGPSAPSLAARYAASRARPAPAQDFIGGPGDHQAPPTAHGRPAPSRVSGYAVREPPAGGARRGPLRAGGSSHRPLQRALQKWDRDNFLQARKGTLAWLHGPGDSGASSKDSQKPPLKLRIIAA